MTTTTRDMPTVLEIIKKTTEFFAARGVENPRLNAELLVGHGLGLKRMALYLQFERLLNESELEKIRPLVKRRGQREPLQYIVGETEFFGLKLKTDRRALIPRPETEYLAELIVSRFPNAAPSRILDLGTGSGALALALAKQFGDAQVTAVDLSADALTLAAENAVQTGLEGRINWILSDWFAALPPSGKFDLIAANPPYLTPEETAESATEVREHEPVKALTGAGGDGLGDLRAIVLAAPRFLDSGGLLALETGIAQHAALLDLIAQAGLTDGESCQDLTGRNRYVFARAMRDA
ncbi:MAG TPA: peptide chain release factor N(5)-glutamine methyltransferase [Opitutus sp.]|nr:peptide chain release factor N(5)-glutamine methyltransferase [Opitutus sp.]